MRRRNPIFEARRCRLVAALIVVAVWSCVGPATADTLSEETGVRALMLVSEAEREDSEQAILAVRAQLSDLNIALDVAWVPSHSRDFHVQADRSEALAKRYNASIVFWSDLLNSDRIFIYVSEPGGGRFLVRSVDFEENGQAGRFEVVAVIVRTSVEAIVDGGHIGVMPRHDAEGHAAPNVGGGGSSGPAMAPLRDDLPRPKPRSAPKDETPRERENPSFQRAGERDGGRLEIAAAYALTLYAPEAWLIHGVHIGVAARIARRGWLYMSYQVQIPFEVSNALVSMKLRPHPFEIGFATRIALGPIDLDVGAGVTNDPLTWTVTPGDPSRVAGTDNRFRWLCAVSPFVGLSWSPWRRFKLYLSVPVRIYVNESPSYVERRGGDKVWVVDPLDARPQFQAGAVFFLF